MKLLSKTILFIDDDPDDLEFYGESMRAADPTLQIEEARSGLKAMEYLLKAKASNTLPSLIVLDVNMPQMSGRETLLELKKDEVLSTIPVVIFSTATNPREKEYFMNFEIAYFTKPSTFAEMEKLSKELLSFSSGERVIIKNNGG